MKKCINFLYKLLGLSEEQDSFIGLSSFNADEIKVESAPKKKKEVHNQTTLTGLLKRAS